MREWGRGRLRFTWERAGWPRLRELPSWLWPAQPGGRLRRHRRAILGLAAAFLATIVLTAVVEQVAYALEQHAETRTIAHFVTTLAGKRIVIDPGHGGIDPGAERGGVGEDTLNLAMSEKLAGMLRTAGATVVLTRTSNDDLSGMKEKAYAERKRRDLHTRVAMIRKIRPDIVVSVHCNASTDTSWRGAQAFFGSADPEESKRLAANVQHALREITQTRRWANSGINHYILEQSPAPAITVEAGFLSNPQELHLLTTAEYQQRVAFAVFLGIAHYFAGEKPTDPTA